MVMLKQKCIVQYNNCASKKYLIFNPPNTVLQVLSFFTRSHTNIKEGPIPIAPLPNSHSLEPSLPKNGKYKCFYTTNI